MRKNGKIHWIHLVDSENLGSSVNEFDSRLKCLMPIALKLKDLHLNKFEQKDTDLHLNLSSLSKEITLQNN